MLVIAHFHPSLESRRQWTGKIIAAKTSSGRQPVASAKQKIDNESRTRFAGAGPTNNRTEISKKRSPKLNSSPSSALKRHWAEQARQIATKSARIRVAPIRKSNS